MKCIIIEDEAFAAQHLERILLKLDPSAEILAKISSVQKAVEWFSENSCDLVFLDVHLGDDMSFSIFEQTQVDAFIIFTTAFDDYAIQAFKLNSIDYLLKPILEDDLSEALAKYHKYQALPAYHKLPQYINPSASASASSPTSSFQKRFLVQTGERIKTIFTEEIAYFYVQGRYVFAVTQSGDQYILDTTMDMLEPRLDPELFFRINRQFIISIHSIDSMHNYSRKRLKIVTEPPSKEEMIVSVERAHEFRAWLNR